MKRPNWRYWIEGTIKVAGFFFIALLMTNVADIFIVGLQFKMFSTKWWALYAGSVMILLVVREGYGEQLEVLKRANGAITCLYFYVG